VELIQGFKCRFVALLGSFNRLSFGDFLLGVGQVAFSGRYSIQMRLSTSMDVPICKRNAINALFPILKLKNTKKHSRENWTHAKWTILSLLLRS